MADERASRISRSCHRGKKNVWHSKKNAFFVVFCGKYDRDVPWLLQGA